MPIKAIWNNITIAQTGNYKILSGNYYFPPESVHHKHLKKNGKQYTSRWKGTADYYDVIIDDKINKGAAWSYADPNQEAQGIQGYFSFKNGVEIIKINEQ